MAILQVKSVPDELYAALGERAKREGISMSELVIRTLGKELAKPSRQEWVERMRKLYADDDIREGLSGAELIRQVRDDEDADWDRLWAEQDAAARTSDA